MVLTDIRKIYASVFMLFSAAAALAVPAQRGLRTYTQPDGATLSVTLNGDESFHYYTTSDGLPLIEEQDGTLYFARIEGGVLRRTDFKACDPQRRTPEMNRVLSSADPAGTLRLMRRSAAPARRLSKYDGVGRFKTTFPDKGSVRALVILVEYTDVSFQTPEPASYFTDMLNKTGFDQYGGTGCAREYFLDASDGKFDLNCDVYGPVSLPRNRAYYGSNASYGSDSNPEDMVVHAIKLLDDEVDFSAYDCDKDGILDNVFIFYAGQGEASGGPASSVWPHAYELTKAGKAFTVDGVLVDHYACTNEWQKDTPDGIGTFCHEFSHIMGLPDLYATDGSDANTPGEWSVMDYGPYNNNSRTPPTYSAYERNAMGWLNTVTVEEACSPVLEDIKTSNSAVLIPTSRPKEFYLFENRQQTGWDKYLPGHGMLIWHVDYNTAQWNANTVNNDPYHQYVDLVEADPTGENPAASCWPGPLGRTDFTASSMPAFLDWKGQNPGFPVTGITEENGLIHFDVDGGDFTLGAPASLRTEEVTPVSMTVSWEPVQRARGYRVSVYTESEGGRRYVRGFEESVFGADDRQARVSGLDAETDYVVCVKAFAGTRVSEPVSVNVRTPQMSFPYITPETLPAEAPAATSFTARWKPVEGAESYLITVEGAFEAKPRTETCDFGSLIFRVPAGWEYSLKTSRYTDPNWCGAAVPSAKLDRDGASLTSPEFEHDIQAVSFWVRLAGNKPEEALVAEMLVDGQWKEVESITDLPQQGETISLSEIPEHARRLRITYKQTEKASLALDDVEITVGGVTRTLVQDFDKRDVGNVTSCLVDNLPMGETGFYYRVAARSAAGETTFWSDDRYVVLSSSGILSATSVNDGSAVYASAPGMLLCTGTPDSEYGIFSPEGLEVARGHLDASGSATVRIPSGLLIVKIGRDVHKVMAR